jgi:ketosteroid isomerase-like protein
MRQSLFSLLLLCLITAAAFAQGKSSKGDTEETIRQLERRRFDLMIKKDLTALRDLLAEDLIYTHSSGVSENREEYLQGFTSGKSVYYAVKPEETKIRLYGNTAFVNGIALVDTDVNGQKTTLRLKYTDAWVKRNGKWQFVTWQSLRMPQ